MSYSLSEAATACGVHRGTIRQSIKTGRLSGTKDAFGQWRIEPAELHRVYPYPYVVELAVDTDKLNVELSRRSCYGNPERSLLAAFAVYAPLTKAAHGCPTQQRAVGHLHELQPSEAATACGVHMRTIRQSIKTGRLSGTKDAFGQWRVEPAELHRVYPYPYVVELAVDTDKLNVELSRRMLHFHKSRNIQVRHGRRIMRETQIYFRWCFSDSATARAFTEQFGGELNI